MDMKKRAEAFSAEEETILLDTIDRWVEKELRPIVREYDHEDRYPHEIVE